jgi:hypothetical protein
MDAVFVMVVLYIDNKRHANEHQVSFDIRVLAAKSIQAKLPRSLLTFCIACALGFISEMTRKTRMRVRIGR